jgi:hypothetical protein
MGGYIRRERQGSSGQVHLSQAGRSASPIGSRAVNVLQRPRRRSKFASWRLLFRSRLEIIHLPRTQSDQEPERSAHISPAAPPEIPRRAGNSSLVVGVAAGSGTHIPYSGSR